MTSEKKINSISELMKIQIDKLVEAVYDDTINQTDKTSVVASIIQEELIDMVTAINDLVQYGKSEVQSNTTSDKLYEILVENGKDMKMECQQ